MVSNQADLDRVQKYRDTFAYWDGQLYWRTLYNSSQKPGKAAGTKKKDGYIFVCINKKQIVAHRIVWEIHNGPIPIGFNLDHIDGIRSNNKIENLRIATRMENSKNRKKNKNSKSGYKGAYYSSGMKKWGAQIQANNVPVRLGWFPTAEEAARAYDAAARKLHGDFACLNFPEENFPIFLFPGYRILKNQEVKETNKARKRKAEWMKFSSASGGGVASLDKKPKNVFSVDETQKGNYPQLCGGDSPQMLSAGLPNPSKPNWQSRMSDHRSDHREETLWKMLETGNPELVPINSIPALSVWGSPMRSRLCASGKIPAIKVADQWFSCSQMVIDALKNHHEKSKAFALMPPATPRKRGRPRARN